MIGDRDSRLAAMLSRVDLKLIAVDADDTLWHDGRYFARVDRHFVELCVAAGLSHRTALEEIDRIDAEGAPGENAYAEAILASAHRVGLSTAARGALRATCDAFLIHEVELLPNVEEALAALRRTPLALVTKGKTDDQHGKLGRAGVKQLFDRIVVVQRKDTAIWREVFACLGSPPEHAIVIGNNLAEDIRPAISIGAAAIWLNHKENAYRHDDDVPADVCVVDGWLEILKAVNVR